MMKAELGGRPPDDEESEKWVDLHCGEEEDNNGYIPGRAQKTFLR